MDDVAWQALAVALTLLGGAYTWYAAKNRGAAAAVRGAGLTLLVPAAYLTGTLEMAGQVVSAVGDWATGFVFSPSVWLGLILAGLAGTLLVVGGWMAARGTGAQPSGVAAAPRAERGAALPRARTAKAPVDDDLADIEAILKKRGIT